MSRVVHQVVLCCWHYAWGPCSSCIWGVATSVWQSVECTYSVAVVSSFKASAILSYFADKFCVGISAVSWDILLACCNVIVQHVRTCDSLQYPKRYLCWFSIDLQVWPKMLKCKKKAEWSRLRCKAAPSDLECSIFLFCHCLSKHRSETEWHWIFIVVASLLLFNCLYQAGRHVNM